MDFDFVFPVSEGAVATVGCCWNGSIREALIGKNVRCIRAQAAKCVAWSAMFELALFVAFFQKIGIAVLQIIETVHKDLFGNAPHAIFVLHNLVLEICKSVSRSPTEALEYFQNDKNHAISRLLQASTEMSDT